MQYNNSKIRQRIDTKSNWEDNVNGNPVLGKGEIAWVTEMNSQDLTQQDLKIGDGTSNFTSLPYVIANNKEVKAAKTTANAAQTTATSAAGTATTAATTAATATNNIAKELVENYSGPADLFNEHLSPNLDSINKRDVIQEWVQYADNGAQPTYRITDTISIDMLFIILKSLSDANIISYDSAKINNFVAQLEQNFAVYTNTTLTENRTELDALRNSYIR